MDVLHINILDKYDVDIFVTFATFQTGSKPTHLVSTILIRNFSIILKLYRDVLNINICRLIYDLQTRSESIYLFSDNSLRNAWIILNLYRNVHHINNSDKFGVDLSVTFSTRLRLICHVNLITSMNCFHCFNHQQGCSQTNFH